MLLDTYPLHTGAQAGDRYPQPVPEQPWESERADDARQAVQEEEAARARHASALQRRNNLTRALFVDVDKALPDGAFPHTQVAAAIGMGNSTFRSITRDLNDARRARQDARAQEDN